MNRQLRNAVSRVRKAQDAIYSGKCKTECVSISISMEKIIDSNRKFISIWAQIQKPDGERDCDIFYLHDTDRKEYIESGLQRLSELINYAI